MYIFLPLITQVFWALKKLGENSVQLVSERLNFEFPIDIVCLWRQMLLMSNIHVVMFALLKRLSEVRVVSSVASVYKYMFMTKLLSVFCLSWCHDVLQARSYIQSLAYKPTVPWTRIFPNADPNGERRHIDVIMLFSFLEDSLTVHLIFWLSTLLCTVEHRYNKGPRDWQNWFTVKRFCYIDVLFHIFYCYWGKENSSLYHGLCYILLSRFYWQYSVHGCAYRCVYLYCIKGTS